MVNLFYNFFNCHAIDTSKWHVGIIIDTSVTRLRIKTQSNQIIRHKNRCKYPLIRNICMHVVQNCIHKTYVRFPVIKLARQAKERKDNRSP